MDSSNGSANVHSTSRCQPANPSGRSATDWRGFSRDRTKWRPSNNGLGDGARFERLPRRLGKLQSPVVSTTRHLLGGIKRPLVAEVAHRVRTTARQIGLLSITNGYQLDGLRVGRFRLASNCCRVQRAQIE